MIPEKQDWSEVIWDIKRLTRWSDAEIGRRADMSPDYVGKVKNGDPYDLTWRRAARLLNLREELQNARDKNNAGELGTLGAGQIPQATLRKHGTPLSQPTGMGGLGERGSRPNAATHGRSSGS